MARRIGPSAIARPWLAALLGGFLFAQIAAGQGISATVDRAEATLEDRIVLTITIEGSQRARPELPELPDFDVLPGGQSTQMSIVNGRASSLLIPSMNSPMAAIRLAGR